MRDKDDNKKVAEDVQSNGSELLSPNAGSRSQL